MERCPCCKARLNNSAHCPRCTADLSQIICCENLAKDYLSLAVQQLGEQKREAAISFLSQSLQYQTTDLALVMKDFLLRQKQRLDAGWRAG